MRIDGAAWPRQRGILALVVVLALLLRLTAYLAWDRGRELEAIERANVFGVLSHASGKGFLRKTSTAVLNTDAQGQPITPIAYAEQREAQGGRVDPEHPYPADTTGWMRDTLHVFGYTFLLSGLYELFNYSGMIDAAHVVQMVLDALVPLLLFALGAALFSQRVGLAAAWIYAFLPPPIFLVFTLTNHSLTPFLGALILATASRAGPGRERWVLAAGAAVGLASLFRPDFLPMLGVLFLIYWATSRSLLRAAGRAAAAAVVAFAVYSPWIAYASDAAGRLVVTTTTGAGLYQHLGILPGNPWGIVLDDNWIERDAVARGLAGGAWSPEADLVYRELYARHVREEPLYVAKLVLLHRLPFALATPYLIRDPRDRPEFRFGELRRKTGLSNWGVVQAYPGTFLRLMWPEIAMIGLSGLLSANLVALLWWERHRWRTLTWLLLPWAYHVGSLSMVKYIEPQNIAVVLGVQSVGLGLTLVERVPRLWPRPRARVVEGAA
jgi:hypothetical protein